MRRISIVVLAVLLALTACGSPDQAKPTRSNAAPQPTQASAPPVLSLSKQVALTTSNMSIAETGEADDKRLAEYAFDLGGAYAETWRDYLQVDLRFVLQTLVFPPGVVLVTECTVQGKPYKLDPQTGPVLFCMVGEKTYIYFPAASAATEWRKTERSRKEADFAVATWVARGYANGVVDYLLRNGLIEGNTVSDLTKKVLVECLAGITLRASHSGESFDKSVYGLPEPPSNEQRILAFKTGYASGRVSDCLANHNVI